MKFAIFGNSFQAEKSVYARQLFELLRRKGHSFIIEGDFYRFLTEKQNIDVSPDGLIEEQEFDADMVVSLGGDGTFLKAAARVGSRQIPVLGINSGRLGFLSSLGPAEMEQMLGLIAEGRFELEERSLIEVRSFGESYTGHHYALNEVALLKHATSSMIAVHLSIDGEAVVTYQADGLIVATPTGSTGYSLSVGGPIVSPMAEVFVVSPVAPHSLTARPLVLRDDRTLSLRVESRSHNFLIAVDGCSQSCSELLGIELRKAPYKIKVVKRVGESIFQVLRQKMMWGVDSRN